MNTAPTTLSTRRSRRDFLTSVGWACAGITVLGPTLRAAESAIPQTKIVKVRIGKRVEVEAEEGTTGIFGFIRQVCSFEWGG